MYINPLLIMISHNMMFLNAFLSVLYLACTGVSVIALSQKYVTYT